MGEIVKVYELPQHRWRPQGQAEGPQSSRGALLCVCVCVCLLSLDNERDRARNTDDAHHTSHKVPAFILYAVIDLT